MVIFNTKRILKLTFILCISFILQTGYSQRFKASAVFGLNVSQIDGDNLYGFSKLGLTGGVKLAYPLRDNIDVNLEMLYSQRGSTSGFGFGSEPDIYTDMQYIELPLYISIKDWYFEEEGYHKVRAHAGLSFGNLFGVDSSSGVISNDIDTYNRTDISYLLGVGYNFTKQLGLTIRFTRSFNSLYKANNAIGYFVTTRAEFKF